MTSTIVPSFLSALDTAVEAELAEAKNVMRSEGVKGIMDDALKGHFKKELYYDTMKKNQKTFSPCPKCNEWQKRDTLFKANSREALCSSCLAEKQYLCQSCLQKLDFAHFSQLLARTPSYFKERKRRRCDSCLNSEAEQEKVQNARDGRGEYGIGA